MITDYTTLEFKKTLDPWMGYKSCFDFCSIYLKHVKMFRLHCLLVAIKNNLESAERYDINHLALIHRQ